MHTHIDIEIEERKRFSEKRNNHFSFSHPLRPFFRPLSLFTRGYVCILYFSILFSILTINPASILLNDKKKFRSEYTIRYDEHVSCWPHYYTWVPSLILINVIVIVVVVVGFI